MNWRNLIVACICIHLIFINLANYIGDEVGRYVDTKFSRISGPKVFLLSL